MGYLKFLPNLLRGRARYPLYLILFVTSKCSGKCRHCFYWKRLNADEKELTLSEIELMCRSMGDMLQVTLTGGDACERLDLPEIAELFSRHNHAANITLVTNGWHPERVEEHVRRCLEICKGSNITVDLTIDGQNGLHDEIRGTEGMYERVVETARRLIPIRDSNKHFDLCLNTTVSAYNQHQLLENYDWIVSELRPSVYNAFLTRGEPRDSGSLEYDLEPYRQLGKAMEHDIMTGRVRGYSIMGDILSAKDAIMRDLVLRILEEDKYIVPCTAGLLTGVVYPEGEVHICELDDKPVGNLRRDNYDLSAIWRSEEMLKRLRAVQERKCHCIHQCFLSNNILFNPRFWLPMISRVLCYKLGRVFSKKAKQ